KHTNEQVTDLSRYHSPGLEARSNQFSPTAQLIKSAENFGSIRSCCILAMDNGQSPRRNAIAVSTNLGRAHRAVVIRADLWVIQSATIECRESVRLSRISLAH